MTFRLLGAFLLTLQPSIALARTIVLTNDYGIAVSVMQTAYGHSPEAQRWLRKYLQGLSR